MDRFTGLIGIVLILGIAYALSDNRKAINYRTVGVGLALQFGLALFVLKTDAGQNLFQGLGYYVDRLLQKANKGAEFVFASLVKTDVLQRAFGPGNDFIFFFKVIPTIIFVAVLVNIFYHLGIMQRVVAVMARAMKWLMGVSGAEALSNVASTFVGQVEGADYDQALSERDDQLGVAGQHDRLVCLHSRWRTGGLHLAGRTGPIFAGCQHHGPRRVPWLSAR